MKILIISHRFYPDIGGIETISEGLADIFCKQGYAIRVMTHTNVRGERDFSYPIIRAPSLRQIVQQLRWADVVLENNPALRLSWLNIFINKPFVVVLQTWFSDTNKRFSFISFVKKMWLRRARKVIACSKAIRNEMYKKAVVIDNFYNDKIFQRIDGQPKVKDFVYLGRLVVDKGVDLATRAFEQLLHTYPDSNFTIIGDGVDMPKLKQYVKDKNLNALVSFKGNMRGTPLVECLNEHRFLLVPSIWKEPFGIVALEGMACGCIPLVSDGGGLPDAVGKAGLVFERGNQNDLLEKMILIKKDKALQLQLLEAASEHLGNHKLASLADSYLIVIKEAL